MHATAQRLADAALELFGVHGYDRVTTADIADAVGVSQRTFFRHFATKQAVLFPGADTSMADFVELLYRQPVARSITDALVDTIAAHAERWPPTDDDVRRVRIARATESLSEFVNALQLRFELDLVRWIAQRTRRPESDFDVRVLAATLVAARRVVIDEWLLMEGQLDLVGLARRAIDAIDSTSLEVSTRPDRSTGEPHRPSR